MDQTASIHGRLLTTIAALAAVVVTMGCGNSPSQPTAAPSVGRATASGVASAATQPESAALLAQCLGGSSSASCFNASRVMASVNALAFSSAPIFNNNNPVLTSGTTVVLSWAPASGGLATSYVIEASGTPGGPASLANFDTGTSATTLVVPGVPSGVYYVRVRARDASGLSAASNEVQVVVAQPVGLCPSAPTNLVFISQTNQTVTLAWQPPVSGVATSYLVVAGSAPGLANIASLETASTTLVVPNVPANSYYVRVFGKSSSCGPPSFVGPASNEVLVFVIDFTGDVQVSVSWDAPSDVDVHLVEPSGNEIDWDSPSSPSGGQLDVDSNAACNLDRRQVENIRYGVRAPTGTYIVRVDYWDYCGVPQTNFIVTVKNGPSTQTFTGTFTGAGDRGGRGSGQTITAFAHVASEVISGVLEMFRLPPLFTPSPEKLRLSSRGR